jgi:thymidylate synthase (FAD)
MKVKLISYTIDPERTCAAGAKTSFTDRPSHEHFETMKKDDIEKTIKMVIGYGHHSVIEHANFTFSIEGISRACSHQLVRHRIASFTQQSQRYVKIKEFDPVVPPTIAKNEKAKKIFNDIMKKMSDAYYKLIELDIPKEDARFVLPNAAKTNITVTMNARELLHVFALRCCYRAQWEIREVATEMLKQVKKVAPTIFENAGPSCVQLGFCPEKDLMPEECKKLGLNGIKEKFRKM